MFWRFIFHPSQPNWISPSGARVSWALLEWRFHRSVTTRKGSMNGSVSSFSCHDKKAELQASGAQFLRIEFGFTEALSLVETFFISPPRNFITFGERRSIRTTRYQITRKESIATQTLFAFGPSSFFNSGRFSVFCFNFSHVWLTRDAPPFTVLTWTWSTIAYARSASHRTAFAIWATRWGKATLDS